MTKFGQQSKGAEILSAKDNEILKDAALIKSIDKDDLAEFEKPSPAVAEKKVAFERNLVSIILKLKKKNKSIDVGRKQFQSSVEASGISLNEAEEAVMEMVSQVNRYELIASGSVIRRVDGYWNKVVSRAESGNIEKARRAPSGIKRAGELNRKAGEFRSSPNGKHAVRAANRRRGQAVESMDDALAETFNRQVLVDVFVRLKKFYKEKLDQEIDITTIDLKNTLEEKGLWNSPFLSKEDRAMINLAYTKGEEIEWKEIAEEAEKVASPTGLAKYVQMVKDNPKTSLLIAGGLASIFILPKLLSSPKEKSGGGWMKWIFMGLGSRFLGLKGKSRWGILGLGALASWYGYDKIKAMFNIDKGIAKLLGISAAHETAEKAKEELEKGRDKARGVVAKGRVLKEKGKEKVDTVVDEYKEKKEALGEHKNYAKFIKERDPSASVSPYLFGILGKLSVSKLIETHDSSTWDRMVNLYMKVKDADKTVTKQNGEILVTQFGGEDLAAFLKENLKEGKLDELKNQSVENALDTIMANESTYLDAEKIKAAKERPTHVAALNELLGQLRENPKIVTNKEFRFKAYEAMLKSGYMIGIDDAGQALLFASDSLTPMAVFGGNEVQGAFMYMGQKFKEEYGVFGYVGGTYLQGAGLVAGIGVPAYMVKGVFTAIKDNPLKPRSYFVPYTALKGGLQGVIASFKFPAKAISTTAKSAYKWKVDGTSPLDTLREAYYRKSFSLEKFRARDTIQLLAERPMGQKLNLVSYIDRVTNGEVKVTHGLLHRLDTYRKLMITEEAKINAAVGKGMSDSTSAQYFRNQINKIDELKKLYGFTDVATKALNPVGLFEKLDKLGITDPGISDLMQKNDRLILVLTNEKHPMRMLAGKPNSAGFKRLVRATSEDPKLLDMLTRNPGLAQDSKVIAAFNKGNFEVESFKKIVDERAKAWQKLSFKELSMLRNEPALTGRYTKLNEELAEARKLAAAPDAPAKLKHKVQRLEILKRHLTSKSSIHGRFLKQNEAKLSVLFEDSDKGRKALSTFLAIDPKVLKHIEKQEAGFFYLAKNLGSYELEGSQKAIQKSIETAREKLGLLDHAKRAFKGDGLDKLFENDPRLIEIRENSLAEIAEHSKAEQKAAENFQEAFQKAGEKNPNLSIEEFKASSTGKMLSKRLTEAQNLKVRAVDNFTERVSLFFSAGQKAKMEKLTKIPRDRAARFIANSLNETAPRFEKAIGKFLVKPIGKKLIIFAPVLALRAYAHGQREGLEAQLKSAAVGMTPVAGTLADFYSFFSGKDYFTEQEVSRWESLGWAVSGVAMDIGALFWGAGAAARVAVKGAKGGVKLARGSSKFVKGATKFGLATTAGMTVFTVGKMAFNWESEPRKVAEVSMPA